jgi:predicted transglutaminase-like cysteine proteinase
MLDNAISNPRITFFFASNKQTLRVYVLLGFIFVLFSALLKADGPILFTEALFESVRNTYGDDAEDRIKDWQEVLADKRDSDVDEQLYAINRFFNRVEFVDDIKHWRKKDYWATPIEFLATDGGDCEDFTIAKYFSLRELGIPAAKLRLMYVKAIRLNQAHMVLAYYESPNSVPLVLDNINPRILPASKRRDLLPVYSFNGEGLWMAKAQGTGRKVQAGGNNSLWEDLTARIDQGL